MSERLPSECQTNAKRLEVLHLAILYLGLEYLWCPGDSAVGYFNLMPGEVGTSAFWNGIIGWVEGADLETVLEEIDRSWPE